MEMTTASVIVGIVVILAIGAVVGGYLTSSWEFRSRQRRRRIRRRNLRLRRLRSHTHAHFHHGYHGHGMGVLHTHKHKHCRRGKHSERKRGQARCLKSSTNSSQRIPSPFMGEG